MFGKVIKSLRRIEGGDSFQGYISSLHRRGYSGVPTADEAKKDYRASHIGINF